MAIYGIGANYSHEDISEEFIAENIAAIGWDIQAAPDLHQMMKNMKIGDVVYIKSFSPSLDYFTVKAVGIIKDDDILSRDYLEGPDSLGCIGRNVLWLNTVAFKIDKPLEKNNVRNNTLYEEQHIRVQKIIIKAFNKEV